MERDDQELQFLVMNFDLFDVSLYVFPLLGLSYVLFLDLGSISIASPMFWLEEMEVSYIFHSDRCFIIIY